MQKQLMMIMALTLAAGSLARASTPTPMPPAVQGELDGIFSYCIKIDPRDEDKFEKLRKLLTGGTGQQTNASNNKDSAYRDGFNSVQSLFANMPPAQALKLCQGPF